MRLASGKVSAEGMARLEQSRETTALVEEQGL